jgi:hypothetical protein
MNFFNGHEETVHLEGGQSFGIPPLIYQCLAQAAISAWELAGISSGGLARLTESAQRLFLHQKSRFQSNVELCSPIT